MNGRHIKKIQAVTRELYGGSFTGDELLIFNSDTSGAWKAEPVKSFEDRIAELSPEQARIIAARRGRPLACSPDVSVMIGEKFAEQKKLGAGEQLAQVLQAQREGIIPRVISETSGKPVHPVTAYIVYKKQYVKPARFSSKGKYPYDVESQTLPGSWYGTNPAEMIIGLSGTIQKRMKTIQRVSMYYNLFRKPDDVIYHYQDGHVFNDARLDFCEMLDPQLIKTRKNELRFYYH